MSIKNTRMLAKAIEQRWPIKPEHREAIMLVLLKVIASPDSSAREKTSAARALLAADAQNIEVEKMQQADEHEYRARLVAIAKHIGFSEVAGLASNVGIELADPTIVEQDTSDRAGTASRLHGKEASEATGPLDTTTGESNQKA